MYVYMYAYVGYIAGYYILLDAIKIIKFQMVLNQFSITFAFYRNKFRDLLNVDMYVYHIQHVHICVCP